MRPTIPHEIFTLQSTLGWTLLILFYSDMYIDAKNNNLYAVICFRYAKIYIYLRVLYKFVCKIDSKTINKYHGE